MEKMITYLTSLQGKVFKLLPMREARDKGDNNELLQYLETLSFNYDGAFSIFPVLSRFSELVDVRANIESMRNKEDMPFSKWRAIVLKSTKLVGQAIEKIKATDHFCEEAVDEKRLENV